VRILAEAEIIKHWTFVQWSHARTWSRMRRLAMNHPIVVAVALSAVVFLGVLLCLEVGYRIGKKEAQDDPDGARAGVGAVEGALFGLLGLLLAFSFGGATTRFNTRRALIVEEANAIGTAWLRLDLAPPADQPALRDLFRRYMDGRLAVYAGIPDVEAVRTELARVAESQRALWAGSVAVGRQPGAEAIQRALLPALNEMFDIATTRTRAFFTHTSPVITGFLLTVILLSAVLAGHGMSAGKRRRSSHRLMFAVVTATTMYLICDLEYPRFGLIRVEADDAVLIDLRATMN
jgi:hypothetical protein